MQWKIVTTPDELAEGLFGQVVLWTFEILPYLRKKNCFPAWDIKSRLYGIAPYYTVIPGVFDEAYEVSGKDVKEVRFSDLRRSHVSILGNDWHYLHQLWHEYFKIPDRILEHANTVRLKQNTLGLHYRGNDKNKALWDSNLVSQEDFIALTSDFLKNHPQIECIFIATDEFSFVEYARQQFSHIDTINLGAVGFHKDGTVPKGKGDRAVLDCLLLSRCRYVIKCSSALSGFSKILNPDLEIYRVAASKLFTDIPCFPEAYIPILETENSHCREILSKQMADDWSYGKKAGRFRTLFRTAKRHMFLKRCKKLIRKLF
jgi:hypothetical protein